MTPLTLSQAAGDGAKVPASSKWGLFCLGLAIAAAVAFFWDGIVSLLQAWERPEYSHGYLIPVIAGFLLLRGLRADSAAPTSTGSLPGLILVLLGLLVGLFGKLSGIPDIITYGMLFAIAGLVLIAVGTRRGLRLWPAWVYLFFMLPLPNFLYWPLSIRLQFISSEVGVALIKAFNVPVFLDGNIIDLGTYQLQVAEACSGLRYLFPLMSFGFLFAVLYRGPVWHKIVLFLASVPITIGMNSVRIGIIGLLVNLYGIEQAEGFLHMFEGWVIFAVCIVLLYLLAWVLQRLTRDPQPVHAVLDVDTEGLLRPLASSAALPVTLSLVLSTILISASAAAWHATPSRSVTYADRQRFESFPLTLNDWRGSREYLDSAVEAVLAADDYFVGNFVQAGSDKPVNLLVAYYRSQTEGSGIHSPEVCLPSGGWEVSRWAQASVPVDGGFPVNRAIIQKGQRKQLVYYWFEQRGRRLTSDYLTKAYTIADSITRGRSDGALMRVVTPIEGDDVSAAEQRLNGFLVNAMTRMPDFVPK